MAFLRLFYLSKNTTGGWVTFTAHLSQSLTKMGIAHEILKIGNNTEYRGRDFGYGLRYRNVTIAEALRLEGPKVIVALAKQLQEEGSRLLEAGARLVVHDPTELRGWMAGALRAPMVIRRVNRDKLDGSVFIRHPFIPTIAPIGRIPLEHRSGAIAVSRIDFDKNTNLILDANRLGAGVEIRGFENRLYTKFKILPKYPEWKQSVAAYDRSDARTARSLMEDKICMVDMSVIKGDGGGTQYTFLEAWDVGCVPIVHHDWIRPNDDMRPNVNCLVAHDGQSIKEQIEWAKIPEVYYTIISGGYRQMEQHIPEVIVPQFMEWVHA